MYFPCIASSIAHECSVQMKNKHKFDRGFLTVAGSLAGSTLINQTPWEILKWKQSIFTFQIERTDVANGPTHKRRVFPGTNRDESGHFSVCPYNGGRGELFLLEEFTVFSLFPATQHRVSVVTTIPSSAGPERRGTSYILPYTMLHLYPYAPTPNLRVQ